MSSSLWSSKKAEVTAVRCSRFLMVFPNGQAIHLLHLVRLDIQLPAQHSEELPKSWIRQTGHLFDIDVLVSASRPVIYVVSLTSLEIEQKLADISSHQNIPPHSFPHELMYTSGRLITTWQPHRKMHSSPGFQSSHIPSGRSSVTRITGTDIFAEASGPDQISNQVP
jgi:hypothetical protein